MLPPTVSQQIELLLSSGGFPQKILSSVPLGGGCINEAARISTSGGTYFVKYNLAEKHPGMFSREARGLQLLAGAKEIRIPCRYGEGNAGNHSFLLLEFIDSGLQKPDFWLRFGRSLAALHRHTDTRFGLDHDNYMGSLAQSNRQHSDWVSFFTEERLEPQVRLAREKGEIQSQHVKQFERIYSMLGGIIPAESPALLHGDLWSGNFMVDSSGDPCLFDPAVYFGHRESDLAMTRLFGGFAGEFYDHYSESFPLEKGWEKRAELLNLYPLLIHVNLFGGSYASEVKSIIGKYAW